MPATATADFLRQVCRRATALGAGTLSDAQLLELFLQQRQEAAFEVLLWRHGPLVLGVCHRLGLPEPDAADVFQMTFLTLLRKAAHVRRGECLGSWLHKVAHRLALAARLQAARRPGQEAGWLEMLPDHRPAENTCREAAAILEEEIARLPVHYRSAFVLCCLQGLTQAEAAGQLGCPEGTVASRLAWARRRLRGRLTRRGITLAASTFLALLAPPAEAVPRSLIGATLRTVRIGPTGLSLPLFPLTEGGLGSMFPTKSLVTVLFLVALALSALGIGSLSGSAVAQAPAASSGPQAEPNQKSDLPRAVLLARSKHKNYMKACFSFKHGTNDDPDLKLTHNHWDLLFGNAPDQDTFQVRMVGGDESTIVDLGPLQWVDLKDRPLLPPLAESALKTMELFLQRKPGKDADNVARALDMYFKRMEYPKATREEAPAILGHIYLVHSKSDDYELFALFRVEELTSLDRCVITWKVIPETEARKEEKRLYGNWHIAEVRHEGGTKIIPTSRRLAFSSKGRFGMSDHAGIKVGEYRLVGRTGNYIGVDLVEDDGATRQGILSWKEEQPILVLADPKQERPTSLDPGPGRTVMRLKR
jgi:RNA polymerase sigma factor (sigma-70 family)